MMRRPTLSSVGAAAVLLLGGCSVIFGSELPEGCDEEDFDGDGALAYECVVGDARQVERLGDCDDQNPDVHPGAEERCNDEDDDCDGNIDEGLDTTEVFADCDMDGVGDQSYSEVFCGDPSPLICGEDTPGAWATVAGDCDDQDASRQANCGSCAQVDLLFVIDTSASMVDEQIALAEQLPGVVAALKTGDLDGDMIQDAEPIDDLHVGVITPDLGSGEFIVPGCELGDGDDGVLRIESGALRDPRCESLSVTREVPFLSFTPGDAPADVAAATVDWSCLVRAGTGGCGFEQPLEAALKALTPAASALRFRDATLGQGDGLNRGFLRPDSLLVIVIVTDEDDCSVADPELVAPESSSYSGDLNLRCYQYPDALHPVSRYVSGLLQLRDAEDLIFAVVAGVPRPLAEANPTNPDYAAILEDSRLQESVATSGTMLNFSCVIPGRGAAYPPRRLLQTAAGLAERGSTTVLSSICSMNSYAALSAAMLRVAVDHGARRCAM